jgi:L-threonylcarbamoyladenylate synthase
MKTLLLPVRSGDISENHPAIVQAAGIIRRGGLVAIPTETVYGLAANALDAAAVERVFVAKQRPTWDPLIVHIASAEMLLLVAAEVPQRIKDLVAKFWPGPLTLLLPRSAKIPAIVTAGRPNVAVRVPAHPVAQALIRAAGVPLAAPSANLFGRTSPTSAEHVLRDLDGHIDAVLDAGETTVGVESTVLDVLGDPPLLLRPGGVTREQLQAVLGPVEIYRPPDDQPPEALASPGLAAKHYAPEAKLVLVDGNEAAFQQELRVRVQYARDTGEYIGAMAPEGWLTPELIEGGGLVLYDWGPWEKWDVLAQRLFAGLHYLDKPGVAAIVCPLPEPEGMGLALHDRLMKAAK